MLVKDKLTTLPNEAQAPIDRDEVKVHLRLFSDDSVTDAYLDELISAAVDIASTFLAEGVGIHDYEAYYTNFTDVRLPRYNSTVSRVQYYDTDNDLLTVATSVYFVDDTSVFPTLQLNADQQWPTEVNRSRAAPIKVTYVNEIIDRPAIRQALLIIVSDLYENQSSNATVAQFDLPTAAKTLLKPYRREYL